MVRVDARENQDAYGKYESNTYRCKVSVDMIAVNEELSQ
jgi:hypothetical protein